MHKEDGREPGVVRETRNAHFGQEINVIAVSVHLSYMATASSNGIIYVSKTLSNYLTRSGNTLP